MRGGASNCFFSIAKSAHYPREGKLKKIIWFSMLWDIFFGSFPYKKEQKLLARACGVPVGWRSGSRLATMLVAAKNDILFSFGTSVRRSSRSAFGRSTGNDVSGHYKRHYFLF